ncbi:MAG: hypothetical protein KAI29_05185, partial [Cyclobacteriaceae bacterium]|nr:hypothetical protein [Cyclobacteriaceae bacterium]
AIIIMTITMTIITIILPLHKLTWKGIFFMRTIFLPQEDRSHEEYSSPGQFVKWKNDGDDRHGDGHDDDGHDFLCYCLRIIFPLPDLIF